MILDDHNADQHDEAEVSELEDDDEEWGSALKRLGLPLLTPGRPADAPPELSSAVEQLIADSWTPAAASADVRALVEASLAPTTRAACENDWHEFAAWCRVRGLGDPLDAGEVDVAEYVAALVRARLAMATIRRRLAGIAFAFHLTRRESPSASPWSVAP